MKTTTLTAAKPALLLAATFLAAPSALFGQETLDQRLRIVERKLEIADETAATKAKEGAGVKASLKDGFVIGSNDGAFKLKLGGYVQADSRWFSGGDASKVADTFTLRRIRPQFDGSLGSLVDFRIMPDYAGAATVVQDAYIDVKLNPGFVVRAGKFKQPFGLERLQSGTNIDFVERGYPTSLGPNRDNGIQIGGVFGDGVLEYQIGAFDGVGDGGSSVTDGDDGKDVVGRLFLTPFKSSTSEALSGFSFGAAYSVGDAEGNPSTPVLAAAGVNSGLVGLRTAGQQSFFSYLSNATNAAATVYADGERVRFSPQATWYVGSFGLLGEYVEASHELSKGDTSATLDHSAWQVAASWILTGEANTFKGVTPSSPFDPAKGTWGAFELVGRYGELDIDDDAFGDFADAKKSASKASGWSAGFNWYLTKNLKFQADYEQTAFEGGASKGDRADEEVVFTRLQVAF